MPPPAPPSPHVSLRHHRLLSYSDDACCYTSLIRGTRLATVSGWAVGRGRAKREQLPLILPHVAQCKREVAETNSQAFTHSGLRRKMCPLRHPFPCKSESCQPNCEAFTLVHHRFHTLGGVQPNANGKAPSRISRRLHDPRGAWVSHCSLGQRSHDQRKPVP